MNLFQNRRCFFIILGFLIIHSTLSAQEPVTVERSTNKVILEGTVYYIHIVKPGQTLYSIANAYNISQKEIAIENPGVMSGIQLGQVLKIPVESNLEEEIDTSEVDDSTGKGRIHVVQRGETLYGIGRVYNLTEKELLDANKWIAPSRLKPGMRLTIPEKDQSDQEPTYNEEGLAYHKVKRRETLYSIARYYEVTVQEIRVANPELGWGGPKTGQLIRIPLAKGFDQHDTAQDTIPLDYNYDELRIAHDDPDRTYRIAFFIPFDFQEPEPIDSLIKDVKSVVRRNRIIERYRMEEKKPQAVQFMEFFQGSLLAIDSLQQTGMKLDVRFYDTQKSMDQTMSLLFENNLEKFDLFIGPFHPFTLEIVSAFARKHQIPVITPFYNDLDLIRNNPYLFQLSPSIECEYREAAKLVASKHEYNIVYVREEDSLNFEKHDYFKELIFDGFDDYRPAEPVIFKEVIQKLEHTDEIVHSLSKDRKNLVVVPTRNEALASRVVSTLYFQLKNFDIEVLGTPYWTEFSSIARANFGYLHALNFIFYSSFWVDYLDPRVDEYMAKYRSHYFNEPTSTTRKGINYGIEGYDMTFYFANALRLNGPRFIISLEDYHPHLIQDPFSFTRVSNVGGYENDHITFYQFSPDLRIQEIKVPELPARHYFFRPIEDKRRKRFLFKEEDWE